MDVTAAPFGNNDVDVAEDEELDNVAQAERKGLMSDTPNVETLPRIQEEFG